MLRTLTALGTALLIAGAGAAYAQTSGSTSTGNPPASVNKGAESSTGTMTPGKSHDAQHNATGAVKNPPGAESGTAGVTGGAAFDRSMVGQTVYNRNGEAIGQVKAVHGDRLAVSVGSYLGVGTRDIALTRAQMDTKTTTNNKLTTTLSKQELAAQPEISASNSSTDRTNTRSSNMPTDSSTKPIQRDGTSSTTTSPKQ